MAKSSLAKLGLLATLLSGASAAVAQDTVVVHIETYCWDASADDNTFVCEEGNREWGSATNIPHPPLEEQQPVTQNYTTEHSISEADHARCHNSVKDRPEYKGIKPQDTWVNCSANVDWFMYPILKGETSVGFGDPLENGVLRDALREGGDPDQSWGNVVAEVTSVACNCWARVPVPPI